MRSAALASALMLLAVPLANAAEPWQGPSAGHQHNWSGFYAGGHVSGAWGNHDATIIPDIFILPPRTTIQQSQDGMALGGQVGFNYRLGSWLVGIEGAFSRAGVDGRSHMESPVDPDFVVHTVADINWFASAVGRLGYLRDHTMVYVKGGVAKLDFDFRGYSTFAGTYNGGGSLSGQRTGWTVGAGIEYAISDAWSTRLEYGFFDFGTGRYLIDSTPIELEVRFHSVQLALNYRFY